MSQQELLKKVIQALDGAGIEYMISGSLVSSLQGEPRSTHDIDVVVALQPASVRALVNTFTSPEYYLTEESILEAIQHKGMFNLIDVNSGDKVDFWILTDDPFDCSRFSRKYAEKAMGISIIVSSPEDTILMKLKWPQVDQGCGLLRQNIAPPGSPTMQPAGRRFTGDPVVLIVGSKSSKYVSQGSRLSPDVWRTGCFFPVFGFM